MGKASARIAPGRTEAVLYRSKQPEIVLEEIASDIDMCEIQTIEGWKKIGIDDALLRQRQPMRCPACHAAVRPHKEGSTGQRAHFEHLHANEECRLKQARRTPREGSTLSQRDAMRHLYFVHGGDRDAVCIAYTEAERSGLAPRKRKETASAEVYAKRLWADGIAKGWLQS